FHAMAYGAVVSGAPRFTPLSVNCTETTPTLSDALTETVTVPLTVAPAAGAVKLTDGRSVSRQRLPLPLPPLPLPPLPPVLLLTVTVTGAGLAVLPAASRATARIVCVPLATVVVFQLIWYGALVSSLPTGLPSTVNQTLLTPTLSVADAASVTVPLSVLPAAGEASVTAGGAVSAAGGGAAEAAALVGRTCMRGRPSG